MKSPDKRKGLFNTFVINLASRVDRRVAIASRLAHAELDFNFSVAVEPKDLSATDFRYLTDVTICVWKSHLETLEKASESSLPTLILEDDAVLKLGYAEIADLVSQMELHKIDFLQVGYSALSVGERFSISARNTYDFIIRRSLAPRFFDFFGFEEVKRAKDQIWRKKLPSGFILNDVRYGTHCYIVRPDFARKLLPLNDPAFLSADNFYIALSKMRSFKMARLKMSRCSQDDSPSSFSERYIVD